MFRSVYGILYPGEKGLQPRLLRRLIVVVMVWSVSTVPGIMGAANRGITHRCSVYIELTAPEVLGISQDLVVEEQDLRLITGTPGARHGLMMRSAGDFPGCRETALLRCRRRIDGRPAVAVTDQDILSFSTFSLVIAAAAV